MDGATTPKRRNPLRRAFKAVLHAIVKTIVITRRAVLRYPIVALIIITVVVGSYFAVSSGIVPLAALGMTAAAPARDTRLASIERYLEGQKQADVTMMWESVSEEMRADEEAFADTQRRVTMAKLNGINFTEQTYVGGSALKDGGSVHLYVISITNGAQNGQFPLTFTLNQAGKIARIE